MLQIIINYFVAIICVNCLLIKEHTHWEGKQDSPDSTSFYEISSSTYDANYKNGVLETNTTIENSNGLYDDDHLSLESELTTLPKFEQDLRDNVAISNTINEHQENAINQNALQETDSLSLDSSRIRTEHDKSNTTITKSTAGNCLNCNNSIAIRQDHASLPNENTTTVAIATLTDMYTTESTTQAATTESTTQAATTESTTQAATTESTTQAATTESTTQAATTESTTQAATTESTTQAATTESTTQAATTESTTQKAITASTTSNVKKSVITSIYTTHRNKIITEVITTNSKIIAESQAKARREDIIIIGSSLAIILLVCICVLVAKKIKNKGSQQYVVTTYQNITQKMVKQTCDAVPTSVVSGVAQDNQTNIQSNKIESQAV